MGEVHRLPLPQAAFSLQTAGRLMTEIFPPWVQDLALLVEGIETVQPPGAPPDWQPGGNRTAALFQKTLQRRRDYLHPGADGVGRYRDGAGLFGSLEWLSADDVDRSDYAFPPPGELRRRGGCAGGTDRPQY